MKTQNRKTIYMQEQEDLADLLANKSRHEIYNILEEYDSIVLPILNQKYTPMQRAVQVITIPTIPFLLSLMGFKWIITGDKYLASWFRKIGVSAATLDKYFI